MKWQGAVKLTEQCCLWMLFCQAPDMYLQAFTNGLLQPAGACVTCQILPAALPGCSLTRLHSGTIDRIDHPMSHIIGRLAGSAVWQAFWVFLTLYITKLL